MATLAISNFKGKIVKSTLGDVNSGSVPSFPASYGYNPIWTPFDSSLSFLPAPTSIGGTTLTEPIVKFQTQMLASAGDGYAFGLGMSGGMYSIQATNVAGSPNDVDTITKFTNGLGENSYFGGGMLFSSISGTQQLYVCTDTNLHATSGFIFPASATWSTITGGGGLSTAMPHPMIEFLGKIYVANGSNVAESTDGATFTTNVKLSPGLPANYWIRDMQVSSDGRYLVMIASNDNFTDTYNQNKGNTQVWQLPDSIVALWNGTDNGYTSVQFFKGIDLSCIAVTNVTTIILGKDDEGLAMFDLSGNKINIFSDVGIAGSATYSPSSVFVAGNKLFFVTQLGNMGLSLCSYDITSQSLYNLASISSSAESVKGAVCMPSVHTNTYLSSDVTFTKLYYSVSYLPVATQANNKLYRLTLENVFGVTFQAGQYITQVQKFAKKIKIDAVRVYCEPTTANESFVVRLSHGTGLISGSSSFTYTYAAGTDATQGQGSLTLIKFNPEISSTSQLGVRIVNNGTDNVTIHKIEIDYTEVENPATV